MNDETTYDPFAQDVPAPTPDSLNDEFADDFDDEFADLFNSLDDLEEQESGKAIRVRGTVKPYDDPRDVGLRDGMWIPVHLETVEAVERHVPRLSSKVCYATLNDKSFLLYDQVEAALRAGGEEKIGEVPVPYFVATANHAAPAFGARRFPYEIEVPVFTVKTALFKPQGNRTGYPNEHGRSLRLATGVTKAGETVNLRNMHEIADRMVGTIVMAKVSLSESKKSRFRPVTDENGRPITVLIDRDTGRPIEVDKVTVKNDAGEEETNYFYAESGEVWEGDESRLYPYVNGKFAIRAAADGSDGPADRLEIPFKPYNDYINPPFLPVPERKVTVERLDQTEVEGEITLDTVGAIVPQAMPGAMVDVMLRTGEVVTAVWLGTQWNEFASPEGNGPGESAPAETSTSLAKSPTTVGAATSPTEGGSTGTSGAGE